MINNKSLLIFVFSAFVISVFAAVLQELLEAICEALDCQAGDILEYSSD